ncbi:MAG: ABC transporter substrate-binding protein, partial [Burkholderiaceae bacterium]|nr:ABC transporter substrate-binding protein [Burkholderiaceae bacterium]
SDCTVGRKGRMQVVHPSAEDEVRRKEIFKSTVLPRWLRRCGLQCADLWNQTIGTARGLAVPKVP